ncbi:hypothetical protein AGABI2DRAFT_209131 [Agaricus bisporus var. bisporus H97]|uniref:hypothetical protein n=1 Tax=Agaricus bisporus var. bisporus (strain H97 / ATCC MYA-4626 / FGSC 10389) TaxID=936046 RepID=UPI00029F6CE3|nr:hypothetical protein AGABI2DRAFT_209131 [Agaricus bisporus var. bisporus H97]EKV44764.1 hypothetical protein AGABI2DRAFT_209131 [Agaricus bisporus var. bisporus H97]
MVGFSDFQPLCSDVPSYTWCNLFYRQLLDRSPTTLQGSDPQSAPVGVNPRCGIPRAGHDGSISNIANIVACGVSILILLFLIYKSGRRKAAVGRVEFRIFLIVYLITLPLQIITNGSLLQQGSTALVVFTALHAGLIVALFWILVTNAIVATQWIDDGTMSSLMPLIIGSILVFAGTVYISLDVAFGVTDTIGGLSSPPERIRSIPLFVLTSMWPIISIIVYLALMAFIVLHVLNETRPMWYFLLSAALFVLAQLAWFLLGKVICNGSNQKVDGSFVATILETASVVGLFFAWKSITEESWDDDFTY